MERFCHEVGLFKQLYSVIEYPVTCLRENVCIPQIVWLQLLFLTLWGWLSPCAIWCQLQGTVGRDLLRTRWCQGLGKPRFQVFSALSGALDLHCCVSHIFHIRTLRVGEQLQSSYFFKICPSAFWGTSCSWQISFQLSQESSGSVACTVVFTPKCVQHFPPLLTWLASIMFLFPGKLCMATRLLQPPTMPCLRLVPTEGSRCIKCLLCPHSAVVRWGRVLNRELFFCYHRFWRPYCECFDLCESLPLSGNSPFSNCPLT